VKRCAGSRKGADRRRRVGGWDCRPSSRHIGEVALRNIKEAAQLTVAFCEAHRPRNLLLAGTEATLSQFRSSLPRVWADRVIGAFAADMSEGQNEIRDRAFVILEQVETERESALAEAVITAAAKGSNGVVRLGDTLSAVHEGVYRRWSWRTVIAHPGTVAADVAMSRINRCRNAPFAVAGHRNQQCRRGGRRSSVGAGSPGGDRAGTQEFFAGRYWRFVALLIAARLQ